MDWGPALHSLRTMGDVVAFCQTLITFSQIKSKKASVDKLLLFLWLY
jgi:hypothetical protein